MTSRSSKSKKYSVKGPLSLWYIDGNHEFIRYVFHIILIFSYYSGDIWRHDEEIAHNLLFRMPTNGKNKRGKPQKAYIDQLVEDTGLQMEELKTLMANREECKSFINSNFPKRFDQWVSEWYLVPLPNISIFSSFFSQILIYEIRVMSCKVGQNSNSLLTTCNS